MSIEYKVTIFIPDYILDKYWEDELGERLSEIFEDGYDVEVYRGNYLASYDNYEHAIEAESIAEDLIELYRLKHKQSIAVKMTLAQIEHKLGHPVILLIGNEEIMA